MMNEHQAQPIRPETLQAFGNDAFRARIFHEKYALRGADGTVQEHLPAQRWQRVSQGIAAVEAPQHSLIVPATDIFQDIGGTGTMPSATSGGQAEHQQLFHGGRPSGAAR